MAKFTTLPKVDLPVGATPSEVNQYFAKDATQSNTEILTIITNTGITATDSDTAQVSKAVSRYSMANLFVEGAGSNHSGSSDLYIAVRPSATVTASMKIPTTFIEGSFVFKATDANQSQNVLFQLSTNSAVSLKKYNINNQLIDLDIGEIKADDIIIIHLDLANNTAILKRAGSAEELSGLVGKFNIDDQLDFTTSAPVAGSIGDIYINTVTGTISDGFVGSGSVTDVTANKLYQLYDDGSPFRWYEIDAKSGMLAFDETSSNLKVYTGTFWESVSLPKYGAYTISGDQTHTTTVVTKLAITGTPIKSNLYITFDTGNNRLIPLIAGVWDVTMQVYTNTLAVASELSMNIFKNGAVIATNNLTKQEAELGNIIKFPVTVNGTTDYIEGFNRLATVTSPAKIVTKGCFISIEFKG